MRLQLPSLPSRVFLLALCFCSAEPVESQASLLGPGAAFIGVGVSQIATSQLDDRLASLGYPAFGRKATTIGIGAYRTLHSGVMLGGEFNGLILGEKDRGQEEVGLGGGYVTLGVGYRVRLSQRVRAYPRLGLGVGGFGLWIENESDSVDFDDVLGDPTPVPEFRHPIMNRSGGVIDLGGGVEFLRSRRGSGPMLGLRFGYLVAPFSSSWVMYDRKVTDGPDSSISGFYVRGILGGAWRR